MRYLRAVTLFIVQDLPLIWEAVKSVRTNQQYAQLDSGATTGGLPLRQLHGLFNYLEL
jgi:hypothetical protein